MAASYPQVVLFGDSLFEGCVEVQDGFSFFAALQKREQPSSASQRTSQVTSIQDIMLTYGTADCSRRFDVVNRGFSGYNTSQALKILEEVFPKPEPTGPKLKYLVVLLGANDAALPQQVDNQGVPLAQYTSNLRRIVTHPHIAAHAPKILLVTPPPLDGLRVRDLDTEKHGRALRETARSASFSQAARDVAAETGATLLDLHGALLDVAVANTPGWDAAAEEHALGSVESGRRGHLEKLLPDGLHLSGEAYRVLWGLVEGHIPGNEVLGEKQNYVFPGWTTAPWLEE